MKIILVIAGLLIAGGFVFWKDLKNFTSNSEISTGKVKGKSDKSGEDELLPNFRIEQKWDLPEELKEVSGIAYLDQNRFACVQDEDGIVFIYNINDQKIEGKIPFAGAGDYEGITVNGNTAYVVRADGLLYEVDLKMSNKNVATYKTALTQNHNVEGLCFDKENNRLLLAAKDEEPANVNFKGIYAFDLSKKSFIEQPILKIQMDDPVFPTAVKKKTGVIKPSAIGIHPVNGQIFIIDGPKSRLLVMDESGSNKKLYQLGQEFEQPEGVTFNPEGEIFISNEGRKQAANIIKVQLSGN